MKTIDIELAIMNHFNFSQKLIVPNITNFLLSFECDMFILSNSGYATGFEIKVSKNDLKNDLNKRHILGLGKQKNGKTGLEYYFGKFKYFNYAVPELLQEEAFKQIPSFCGLYIAEEKTLQQVRQPKKLFNYKFTDKERYDVARLGAMRIYNLKRKIKKLS